MSSFHQPQDFSQQYFSGLNGGDEPGNLFSSPFKPPMKTTGDVPISPFTLFMNSSLQSPGAFFSLSSPPCSPAFTNAPISCVQPLQAPPPDVTRGFTSPPAAATKKGKKASGESRVKKPKEKKPKVKAVKPPKEPKMKKQTSKLNRKNVKGKDLFSAPNPTIPISLTSNTPQGPLYSSTAQSRSQSSKGKNPKPAFVYSFASPFASLTKGAMSPTSSSESSSISSSPPQSEEKKPVSVPRPPPPPKESFHKIDQPFSRYATPANHQSSGKPPIKPSPSITMFGPPSSGTNSLPISNRPVKKEENEECRKGLNHSISSSSSSSSHWRGSKSGMTSFSISSGSVSHDDPANVSNLFLSPNPAKPKVAKRGSSSGGRKKGAPKRSFCSCKRSRCLKLYCDCFAAGNYCNEKCSCFECYNNVEHEAQRAEAIQATTQKNPNAFQVKIEKQPEKSMAHSTGCHCKKSGCVKRYCECYEGKVSCSERCKCVGCKNYPGSNVAHSNKKDLNTSRSFVHTMGSGPLRMSIEAFSPRQTPKLTPDEERRSDDSIVVQPKRQAPPPAVAAQAAVAPPPSKIAKTKTPKKAAITKQHPKFQVFGRKNPGVTKPCALEVMSYLDNADLYNASIVSRLWEGLALDEALWEY